MGQKLPTYLRQSINRARILQHVLIENQAGGLFSAGIVR